MRLASVFKINHNLNCDSMNVIYIINDLKCKISSIGCTADSMKVRFRNHKSHIKYGYRNCEVSVHFVDNRVMHALDISSCKSYTASLKDHIEVIMIEQVDVSKVAQDSKSRLKECKRREWYWQNQLKTLRQYGGMNIREERLWFECSLAHAVSFLFFNLDFWLFTSFDTHFAVHFPFWLTLFFITITELQSFKFCDNHLYSLSFYLENKNL